MVNTKAIPVVMRVVVINMIANGLSEAQALYQCGRFNPRLLGKMSNSI